MNLHSLLVPFLVIATLASPGPASAAPPGAALLPWYSNDQAVADVAWQRLNQCLGDKGVLVMLPREQVQTAVTELGIDLEKTFGIADTDFKAIGQRLETRYVLGGALTIIKELTFSGWRKDITANLRLHQSSDGREVDYFTTTTAFSWLKSKTATDPEAMAQIAVDKFCAEVVESAARGFQPEVNEQEDAGGFL